MAETVESAKDLARAYYELGIPNFTVGDPGVGKSEMWAQLADEKKIGFKDIRLAQMDPVDLRGLPAVINDPNYGAETVWTRPDFWPRVDRDGPKGIILFDELSDCGKAMQSAAYQIVLNGRAGPHIIPPGWYRAAAGNKRTSGAAAQTISTALGTRFAWTEIEADLKCFLAYGAKMGFHEYVLGYLQFRPHMLWTREASDLTTFPCPRQWERVSKVCIGGYDKTLRARLVGGLVGQGGASDFEAYLKTLDLPSFDEIIANPKKCRIPQQPSSRYALTAMIARYSKEANFDKVMDYCEREDYGKDFWICTVLDATKRDGNLAETSAFLRFANKCKNVKVG